MREEPTPLSYSVKAFCAAMNISRSTFYKEVKLGRINPVKYGVKTLVPASEGAKWLALLAAEQAAKQAA